VKEEIGEARKLFARCGWPVIDVTRRSIEETASSIYQLYAQYRASQPEQTEPAPEG
jgi:regulator of PEP synthase PpsR (kinase-PPPase family)